MLLRDACYKCCALNSLRYMFGFSNFLTCKQVLFVVCVIAVLLNQRENILSFLVMIISFCCLQSNDILVIKETRKT